MKWTYKEPVLGDMIRVAFGSLYHVGIYASDEEVIQFGLAPNARPLLRDSEVEVLSSDIDTFLNGGFLEVAEFDRKERKKHRKPKEVVSYARSKIGTRGYHILYNNCEHFANECLSGEHICRQAEDVRALFRSMPIVDVYLAPLPDREIEEALPTALRNEEIALVTNETVRREKYYIWRLLGYALLRSFGLKIEELSFEKNENGAWHTEKAYFSLSHAKGALAVAVSRAPIGVDIEALSAEYRDGMPKRMMTESEYRDFSSLSEEEKRLSFLTLWTKKEAIFKARGEAVFRPQLIECERASTLTRSVTVGGEQYVLSLATKTPEKLRVFDNIPL